MLLQRKDQPLLSQYSWPRSGCIAPVHNLKEIPRTKPAPAISTHLGQFQIHGLYAGSPW